MPSSLNPLACLALASACVPAAHAADRTVMLPLQEAIRNATAAGKLDGSVKFYLAGSGPAGKVIRASVVTNRKTNAFGKTDGKACDWAAQSALIALQEAARNAGANAVINIASFYRKNENRDPVNYECHAGAVIAGVALKGDLARVE
jgi:uncharacterized protein YbjQ (UPF0145 family)